MAALRPALLVSCALAAVMHVEGSPPRQPTSTVRSRLRGTADGAAADDAGQPRVAPLGRSLQTRICLGNPFDFDAGNGSCDTYSLAIALAQGGDGNFFRCDTDVDVDFVAVLPASRVCPQCGQCVAPTCVGSQATFDAGFGGCETYSRELLRFNPGANIRSCDHHADARQFGLTASEVCPQCEKCFPKIPGCLGDRSLFFDAGGCETYSLVVADVEAGEGNFFYCDVDADESFGLLASEVCVECGACYTPFCLGDPTSFDAGFGACEAYSSRVAQRGGPRCSDVDVGQGLTAAEVCPQCAACFRPVLPPCKGDQASFVAVSFRGRSGCDAYSGIFQVFCDEEIDENQSLVAFQVCPQCGMCTLAEQDVFAGRSST